ncbi:MAG: hypothetical protein ACTSXV_02520 [Alphaproteobacteria bacterium]
MRYFIISILAIFIASSQGIARKAIETPSVTTTAETKTDTTKTENTCKPGYIFTNNVCVKVYCKSSSNLKGISNEINN